MNLFKYSRIFIGIFLTTMVLSVLFLFVNPYNKWGTKPGSPLNLGVDFTGGTKIYFPVPNAVSSDEVKTILKTINIPEFKDCQAPGPGIHQFFK
jgi:preprotein translocase subunit SecF